MPWIEPAEPHAKPPRVEAPGPRPRWTGPLSIDRSAADLIDVEVVRPEEFGLDGCDELSVRDSALVGVALSDGGQLDLDVHRSSLDACDLSGLRIVTIRRSTLTGCKLVGADFSGSTIADVAFHGCAFRYANWRMASFKRVSFVDCTIDEVDGFELTMEDVDLPGTTINDLNVDRLEAIRVDLREASEIGLRAVSGLRGCLISEHQIPALAYSLAMAAGVDIEARPSFEDEAGSEVDQSAGPGEG